MQTNFIDSTIVREIEKKLLRVQTRRSTIPVLLNKVYEHMIEKEATLHSFKIEYESEGSVRERGGNYNSHANGRSIKKGTKNLKNALSWGRTNFDPKKFDQDFIRNLAGRVDPDYHGTLTPWYRMEGVAILGATCRPPRAEKVPKEMDQLCDYIKVMLEENDISSILEAAIYSHLHLVRIHPFSDGNGRTARTLQNVILMTYDLPVPVIYAGERFDYYNHLDRAINNWKIRSNTENYQSKGVKDESDFYNYIAGIVSASLDRIVR